MTTDQLNTATHLAEIYVKTVNGPANAWGQYCHPAYGQSHDIMRRIRQLVGEKWCDRLIDRAFEQSKR